MAKWFFTLSQRDDMSLNSVVCVFWCGWICDRLAIIKRNKTHMRHCELNESENKHHDDTYPFSVDILRIYGTISLITYKRAHRERRKLVLYWRKIIMGFKRGQKSRFQGLFIKKLTIKSLSGTFEYFKTLQESFYREWTLVLTFKPISIATIFLRFIFFDLHERS